MVTKIRTTFQSSKQIWHFFFKKFSPPLQPTNATFPPLPHRPLSNLCNNLAHNKKKSFSLKFSLLAPFTYQNFSYLCRGQWRYRPQYWNFKEALCTHLAVENLGNFHVNARYRHSSFHLYRGSAISHLHLQVFLGPSTGNVTLQFHVSFLFNL